MPLPDRIPREVRQSLGLAGPLTHEQEEALEAVLDAAEGATERQLEEMQALLATIADAEHTLS